MQTSGRLRRMQYDTATASAEMPFDAGSVQRWAAGVDHARDVSWREAIDIVQVL